MKQCLMKSLKIGTRVEMEHTTNSRVARKIALDHIHEYGCKYYPALIKMERKLKRSRR